MTRNRLPGPSRSAPKADPLLARGPSAPLPAAERAHFEGAFGQDFSQVRVRTGGEAAALAGSLGAKAVASGEEIAFAAGRYAPGTAQGRELIGHELAHVAQQREGGGDGPGRAEPRARDAARTAASGGHVQAQALGGAAEGGLYCEDDPAKAPQTPPPGPLLPYRQNFGLPPMAPPWLMPQLQLDPKIDWLAMRSTFGSRGMPFTDRDADGIGAEWSRSKGVLDALGMDQRFKFWFMDQDWLLNAGLKYQLDTVNARDNPNAMDRAQRDWDVAMKLAGETRIPPIPFISGTF